MAHTPAPWSITSQSDGFTVRDSNETIIAAVYGYTDHPNNIANAHLIAAAPAMYEALEHVLACDESSEINIPRDVWQMIRAALALARGEKQ
jgi:hypothetical protein